jgi:WD40 repeat protein
MGRIEFVVIGLAAFALQAAEPEQPVVVRTVAFSPDGKFLAAGFGDKNSAGGLVVWDVASQRAAHVIRGETGGSSAAFSPDGKLLALSEYDRPPKIFDLARGEVIAKLADPCRGPIAFAPDGGTLACGASDKTIHLWNVESSTDRRSVTGAKDRIYGRMVYSRDGKSLLTPCGTAGVYVWDIETGQPRHVLAHGSSFSRAALLAPDDRWIVTGGWDGTVRIWRTDSGIERAKFKGMSGVNDVYFSSSQNLLAVACGKEVRLFGLPLTDPTPTELAQIRALLQHFEDDNYEVRERASENLVRLGFRAESELQRVSAESPLAEVRIRARRARQAILAEPVAILSGHQADVWSLAISPDGNAVASASDDGTVRIWSIAERNEVSRFTPAETEP